jgi:hypothetical protein
MHPLSMEQRRLLILLGILSITTFVYFDLQLITESLSAGYFVSRFVFQLPAAMIVVGMTYVPHF